MEKKILDNGMVSLTASEGYKLTKQEDDPYNAKGQTTVKAEDVELYTEIPVSEIPAYSQASYKAKAAELVRRRYSDSEEFAIQRKMINVLFAPVTLAETDDPTEQSADPTEIIAKYGEYNAYVESCKAEAKRMMEGGGDAR